MSSLYELTQDALALQEMFEDGAIDEQVLADTLESMGLNEKIENICKVIRNLDAKATAFKEEKARMAKRQSECENGVKRLKTSLLDCLNTINKAKIDAGLFTVTKSKSTSVKIVNDSEIEELYLEPQPPKINKTEIGKALKNGLTVKGAELVESEHIRIR